MQLASAELLQTVNERLFLDVPDDTAASLYINFTNFKFVM